MKRIISLFAMLVTACGLLATAYADDQPASRPASPPAATSPKPTASPSPYGVSSGRHRRAKKKRMKEAEEAKKAQQSQEQGAATPQK